MPPRPGSSRMRTSSSKATVCMTDQRLWKPSERRSRMRRMRLTLAGARSVSSEGTDGLVTTSLNSIFLQPIAKRSRVKSQEPGGFLLHPLRTLQRFQQQIFLDAVDQRLEIQSVVRPVRRPPP